MVPWSPQQDVDGLRAIAAIVASVVPSRIPVVVARVVAIFTPVPPILTTFRPIFLAISPVLATIPPVFVAIPALLAPGVRRRWRQADERRQECCHGCHSDAVHLELPSTVTSDLPDQRASGMPPVTPRNGPIPGADRDQLPRRPAPAVDTPVSTDDCALRIAFPSAAASGGRSSFR